MTIRPLLTMCAIACALPACSNESGTPVAPIRGGTLPAATPTATPFPSATPSATAAPSSRPSATPLPTPTPSSVPSASSTGAIYVPINNSSEVEVYAPISTGTVNEAPAATIAGSNTGLDQPYTAALDASGKLYVANYSAPSITVYAPNPTGTLNEVPLATIAGSNTGLQHPFGIAVDAAGKIYVADLGSSSIAVFAANPSGTLNEAPLATIAGSNTGFSNGGGPFGIGLDASGKIYVSNEKSGADSVIVFAANPSGTLNETPLATITGSSTGLNRPYGVAVDAGGRIYVANQATAAQSVTVYGANPSGTVNEAPVATIAGSNTGLVNPAGLAIDASGKVYVADYGADSIFIFAANPTGTFNSAPLATIAGGNTGLNAPEGVAVR
jgi:6-phosphogluconolactonase (cycloisomerase 2 family)